MLKFSNPRSAYGIDPVAMQVIGSAVAFGPSEKSREIELLRIKDYKRPHPVFDSDMRDAYAQSWDWAMRHFSVVGNCAVWSLEEAIEYTRSSQAGASSPGYPYNSPQTPLSTHDHVKQSIMALPDFRPHLTKLIGEIKAGENVNVLQSLSLKDEILKATKIAERKTRLFMSSSLPHHLLAVSQCGDFSDKFQSTCSTWSTAGRDWHRGKWDSFMRGMSSRHKWFLCMDETNFDMSAIEEDFFWFLRFLQLTIPDHDPAILQWVIQQACHGLCVDSRGFVYRKNRGNPSGWFLTLIFNTMKLFAALSYAFITICREEPDLEETLEYMEEHIDGALIGDDSFLALSENVMSRYTPDRIKIIWAKIGITLKPEWIFTQDLLQVEYCGATSVILGGVMVRKPRVLKMVESLIFTETVDPDIRVQRAISIYQELYPVPEKDLVMRVIEALIRRYPHVDGLRRQIPSDAVLFALHTGKELQAVRKQIRLK